MGTAIVAPKEPPLNQVLKALACRKMSFSTLLILEEP